MIQLNRVNCAFIQIATFFSRIKDVHRRYMQLS